jgi:hypothetical protein
MREALGFVLLITALGLPGFGIFCAGVYQVHDRYRFLSAAQVAQGRVQSLTFLRAGEDSSTYQLDVVYPGSTGITRQLSVETSSSAFTEGQSIEVLYTTDPPEARVRGIRTTWGTPVAFLAAGAAWTGFAIFMLVVAFRQRPTP